MEDKILESLSKMKTNHALKIYKLLLENNGKIPVQTVKNQKINIQSGMTILRNRNIADYSDRLPDGRATTISFLKG